MERRLAAILAADVAGYSRLMEMDEAGTLAALKAHRKDLIDPRIAAHRGRIVKLMGDGTLVEFGSVVDAVACAVELQHGMADRTADETEDRRIAFRVGVHLGDVIIEDGDLYGDGVNIAARLEALAAPGGVCVSGQVFDQVESKLDLAFRDLGQQRVKNIAKPIRVYAVDPVGDVPTDSNRAPALHQEIRFCAAADRVRIAYASLGDGLPLVKTANWLNHLEYDWQSPVWSHLLHELARQYRLVRYDERGNGLSDWEVEDISLEAFVRDLETVVDAAGLDRFALFGVSQGCAAALVYAVRHPERVSRIVCYGGYAKGWRARGSAHEVEQREALITLMRQGWGGQNPAFRQIFTSLFMPGATAEQMHWFNELQRISTSPENAVRISRAFGDIDVDDILPQVNVPTLVMHCREDSVTPFAEGRRMATLIPGAQFITLDGRNHLILEQEPAWPRFMGEIHTFLAA